MSTEPFKMLHAGPLNAQYASKEKCFRATVREVAVSRPKHQHCLDQNQWIDGTLKQTRPQTQLVQSDLVNMANQGDSNHVTKHMPDGNSTTMS